MTRNLLTALVLAPALFGSSSAQALTSFDFIAMGNTASLAPDVFLLTNTSANSDQIVGFTLDLTTTRFQVDTMAGAFPLITGPTAADVGLTPLSPVIPDATRTLELTFNDFDPGEEFAWAIDLDTIGLQDAVTGNELIGAEVTVDFASGIQLSGLLGPIPGNPEASGLSVPEPASVSLAGLFAAAAFVRRRK